MNMEEKCSKKVFNTTCHDLVEEISRQTSGWFRKLNEAVGLTAFTLGLGCLWSEQPEFYGWVSFAFVLLLMWSLRSYFPQRVREIRNNKNRSEIEEVVAKGIEAHFFSARKTFKETPVFYVGLIFLWLVANGLHGFLNNKIFPLLGL